MSVELALERKRGLSNYRIVTRSRVWGTSETLNCRFTGINGKVQPELNDAKAGGFERWRLINAGSGESMRMRLYRLDPAAPPLRTVRAEEQVAWRERYCTGQPLAMWQIALDGLTRSAIFKVDEAVLFAVERMVYFLFFDANDTLQDYAVTQAMGGG